MKYTYTLCMIARNEEAILARCLDSFCDLFDEIVIVDTGSTDSTKAIAAKYTDRIYSFEWIDDFSAARNFAFSKCTGDYIYSCDADEVIDEKNRHRFRILMEGMVDEVEIVQMKYVDVDSTVLSSVAEWRPKLFKRLRTFLWTDAVHESVRLEPVVFDSDIEILHMPQKTDHSKRDFSIFLKAYNFEGMLSENMYFMYAKELYRCGTKEDYDRAIPIFKKRMDGNPQCTDAFLIAACIVLRGCRKLSRMMEFFKCGILAVMYGVRCTELSYEIGSFFLENNEGEDAAAWLEDAVIECEPLIDIHTKGDKGYEKLAQAYEMIGRDESARIYHMKAAQWTMPKGDL